MTALAYKLDPNAARETDNGAARLTETGAYTGQFTVAKHIDARSGAVGIEFNFKTDDNREANRLSLYTRNRDGSPIFGEKQLSALMTCLKLREINPTSAQVEVYDYDAKQTVHQQAAVYLELMNKPIGVCLQAEEYLNKQGEVKKRLNLVRFFDAKTRQTASEVLDKQSPVKLDAYLQTLKDKPLSTGHGHAAPNNQAAHADDDFDDDIPF